MLLIPFIDKPKQKLNLSLENKNIEIDCLVIDGSYYLNIRTEEETLINGMRLSNLYPVKTEKLNGKFLIDIQGSELGNNVFIYYIEENDFIGSSNAL